LKINTPKTLKASGRKFWRQITSYFQIEEPQDLKRLEEACLCIDNITEARKSREGKDPFYSDRGGMPKVHPSFKVESDNRTLLIRILREMGLDLESADAPRPPLPGGYK